MANVPRDLSGWIERLGAWYFCPENEGHQVRLHWPADADFAGEKEGLIRAIRSWQPAGNIIDTALMLAGKWEHSTIPPSFTWLLSEDALDTMYPPYLPYLVCFTLAWEEEGSFATHAYYARLNQLLGTGPDQRIGTHNFRNVEPLWHDLERWANDGQGGDLGLFSAISAGHFRYVGYPLAQVALSPADRCRLREIFMEEGLSPDMALEDGEVCDLLLRYRDRFRRRVGTELDKGSEFVKVLCEEVRAELASFEPTPEEQKAHGPATGGASRFTVRLRLACTMGLHEVEGWLFVPCREPDDLRETCQEPFTIRPGQEPVLWQGAATADTADPMEFDDFSFLGQEIQIAGGNTRYVWPSRRSRFFAPSASGDGRLLEHDLLPETGPISILLDEADLDLARKINGQELGGRIPPGCKMIQTGDLACLISLFPQRRGYHQRRSPISFAGGVRACRYEDAYFPYALPSVLVADEWAASVLTTGARLAKGSDGAATALELSGPACPTEIVVEARHQKGRRRRKAITVVYEPGADGEPLAADTSSAYVAGNVSPLGVEPREFRDYAPGDEDGDLDLTHVPSLQLLEVLSTWGSCSYTRFREVVQQLFGRPDTAPEAWHVVTALHDLSHLECLCSGTNGRWQAVGIARGALCRLPWNTDGFAHAILVGQARWGRLQEDVKVLSADVGMSVRAQSDPWAPPRVHFWAADEKPLAELARVLAVRWLDWSSLPGMPSSEDVEALLRGRSWYDGLIGLGEEVKFFSPYRLSDVHCSPADLERLARISGEFMMATQEQSYGGKEYHLLRKSPACRLRLSPGDRQWGRWLCYVRSAQRFYINLYRLQKQSGRQVPVAVPYDTETGLLAFPSALAPPPMAARILCRCSGLLPRHARWRELAPGVNLLTPEHLESLDSPFLFMADGWATVFESVPPAVAEAVAGRLGVSVEAARLQERKAPA